MKNIFLIIFFSTITISSILCQDTFKGQIKAYNRGEAEIITGMAEPIVIGTIKSNGEFSIPLDDNYINQVKETITKENADSDKWSTRLLTLNRAFGNCEDSSVEIENGNQPLVKLSTFNSFSIVDLEEKKMYGHFMVVSSEEFGEALNNYEHGTDQTGYVLDWYYFETPASVKGSCTIKTYTLTQKEEDVYNATTTYDLELKAGWNLVKYRHHDLHTDSEGKKYVKNKSYTNIAELPDNIEYFYFGE
jgi:hypothetical protein